ncbi:MAG: tol-pal system protein YbgF [Gammaproteobacteria bacterium]|nr:tol-pal system protein YbgF [Gammaproteobacteria bacterium]
MAISNVKRTSVVMLLSLITLSAYAHVAPVYDVDNYPPQFDGQNEESAPAPISTPKVQSAPENMQAQSFVPDASLSLEQRVGRLEQQISNMLHDDSATKVNTVQTDVQALRGQVEELTHQVQLLQAQQKTMFMDLDKRVNKELTGSAGTASETPNTQADDTIPAAAPQTKLKLAPPAALDKPAKTPVAVAATAAQPNGAEEQAIYQSAYSLIKAKKYSQAASTLQKMLQKYPTGQFAANAHYWLGELYGLLGKNDQAVIEFSTVVKNYPESPKLADAQLKLGLIYAAQFKWADAKTAFKMVTTQYSGTPSARLASEQLKQIKQAGH